MLRIFRNIFQRVFLEQTSEALNVIDTATVKAENTIGVYIDPVRKSFFKRFPITFSLLVTSGVTAVFLGIERIILKYELFDNSPELILFLGISILVLTGTLYKKLG